MSNRAFFIAFLALGAFVTVAKTIEQPMDVVFEWNQMNFNFPINSPESTNMTNNSTQLFEPENVVPFGLEVYRDRAFLTFPRWESGVPASLAYFNIKENTTKSPLLTPYPNWEAHNMNNQDPEIVSAFRVRADRCGRLWVLDARISGVLKKPQPYGPAKLLVYDLNTDNLLQSYVLPENQMKKSSLFANIAVESDNCEDTYAYAADVGSPGLVVYSLQKNDSWRIEHNFFHPDPLAGNFSISNIQFQLDDGIYGIALSKRQDNTTLLFFHPLSSTMEFVVETSILQKKELHKSGNTYNYFKSLGSRGENAQAGASLMHEKTNIIFYALPQLNALGCWNVTDKEYDFKLKNILYSKSQPLNFPSDISIDEEDRIWVLSNRLHEFFHSNLNLSNVNFKILTGLIKDVILDTPCESKPDLVKKNDHQKNDIKPSTSLKHDDHQKNDIKTSTSSSIERNKILEVTFMTFIFFQISYLLK